MAVKSNDDYPGYCCECAKIACVALDSPDSELPLLQDGLSKGIVLELNQYRIERNLPWDDLYKWISKLYNCSSLPSLPVLKVNIGRLEKKVKELKRNKRHDQMQLLLSETFINPVQKTDCKAVPSIAKHKCNDFEIKVLSSVNLELARELAVTNEQLHHQEIETKQLESKLSKVSVRNTNKKLRRRDEQITHLKEETKENKKLKDRLERTEIASERHRANLVHAKKRAENVALEMDELKVHTKLLETKLGELSLEIRSIEDERECLLQRLEELQSSTFRTKEHQQKYLDNIRQCCMELLSMNVGVNNVDPIIRCVLNHVAGISVDELPHKGTLVRMFAEMKAISCQQIAEECGSCDNLTLHSDGTSKFGQHYFSFQLTSCNSTYSLGLSEMLTGSTTQVLCTFKQILSDFELVAGPNSGQIVLAKIKNTMSDRHIVEKKFNHLLEDYRRDVLPSVVDSWDQFTLEEQNSMCTLNNFYCGMHVLVGMADTAASTLLEWETNHFEDSGKPAGPSVLANKSESGTVRLIRTACKALSKHGSEQSGVFQPFTSYLTTNGVKRNPLASFRGNRFNILFYDAGALYYISSLVKAFFLEVWQTPNQLLRAVLSDIQVLEYLAGCRALGLVNKVITGPLWRILETPTISILDMNKYFQLLVNRLESWSIDASELLCGEAELYPDFPPTDDDIWYSLIKPDTGLDFCTQEILQILCHAFSLLLSRLVCDHLQGGVLDEPSTPFKKQTKSVPKTNTLSERDFAKLDRFLREKPNASTLSLEAIVLFTNNKTAKWLTSKAPDEVTQLFQKARTKGPEFKRLYRDRREQMLQERSKMLLAKQQALFESQQKKVRQKERITQEVMNYGLWQTKDDVTKALSKLKSDTAKVKAIKSQLDFRKHVLEQKYPEKEVYFITKNHKKLSVDELVANLCKLLTGASLSQSTHAKENCDSLVGKRIRHKWCEDGVERWYNGQILNVVAGTDEWFNVQYDGEDQILTLNLYQDIDNGDLDILS